MSTPTTQEVKFAVESAFIEVLRSKLSNNPHFQVSQEDEQFNFLASQRSETFYHPSIVVCCERAPLLQEDMLIYEMTVEIFLTTLAIEQAFTELHDQRLRAIQELFGNDAEHILEDLLVCDPRLKIFRIEAGESENFTDNLHWVDKQPFIVYLQFI